jgi:hypothetical protein
MSLLGGVGCGGDAVDDFSAILASGRREHKFWWCGWLRSGSGCGEKEIGSSLIAAAASVAAVEP